MRAPTSLRHWTTPHGADPADEPFNLLVNQPTSAKRVEQKVTLGIVLCSLLVVINCVPRVVVLRVGLHCRVRAHRGADKYDGHLPLPCIFKVNIALSLTINGRSLMHRLIASLIIHWQNATSLMLEWGTEYVSFGVRNTAIYVSRT